MGIYIFKFITLNTCHLLYDNHATKKDANIRNELHLRMVRYNILSPVPLSILKSWPSNKYIYTQNLKQTKLHDF